MIWSWSLVNFIFLITPLRKILFFCVCILLDFRAISPHETRLYWPSGWELGIGGKCGVGGVVVEGGEVWWWARWTRHSEIKQPEAEADRCPGERRPMVRTRVIFVISFSGKLVTCLFHRRADNIRAGKSDFWKTISKAAAQGDLNRFYPPCIVNAGSDVLDG